MPIEPRQLAFLESAQHPLGQLIERVPIVVLTESDRPIPIFEPLDLISLLKQAQGWAAVPLQLLPEVTFDAGVNRAGKSETGGNEGLGETEDVWNVIPERTRLVCTDGRVGQVIATSQLDRHIGRTAFQQQFH